MKRFKLLLLLCAFTVVTLACRASSGPSFGPADSSASESADGSREDGSASTPDDTVPNNAVQINVDDGANCLFIGHSFFIPVANAFDRLATESGFAAHQADFVFASGARGTPVMLWEDQGKREQIEGLLAGGDVDILGMTVASNPENAFAVYAQWIDLALSYNPDTTFFIGLPWLPGGPEMGSEQYDTLIETGTQRTMEIIPQLREAYPNNPIHFVNYGKIVSEMKIAFDAGNLPDIEALVGRGPTYLFSDGVMGHGGPLAHELSALTWLSLVYGADVDTLAHSDFSDEAMALLLGVIEYNTAFNGAAD